MTCKGILTDAFLNVSVFCCKGIFCFADIMKKNRVSELPALDCLAMVNDCESLGSFIGGKHGEFVKQQEPD